MCPKSGYKTVKGDFEGMAHSFTLSTEIEPANQEKKDVRDPGKGNSN